MFFIMYEQRRKIIRVFYVTNPFTFSIMFFTVDNLDRNRGERMFIIAGLGNPTLAYQGTRHNVGFDVIDALASQYNIPVDRRKNRSLIGKGIIEGQKVILVKPQTYMNQSGESVGALVDYYKVDEEKEIIVIYDDVSLDVGQLRIRKKGSAGGHNGIKSIISHLGTEVFPRIKVGVGEKPKGYDLASYVLGHFSKEDREIIEEGYQKAIRAVTMIMNGRTDAAMNEYNRKIKPKEGKNASLDKPTE